MTEQKLKSYLAQANLSESTRTTYFYVLREYLKAIPTKAEAGRTIEYIKSLARKKIAPRTFNFNVYAIRWFTVNVWGLDLPIRKLCKPVNDNTPAPILTAEQFEAVKDNAVDYSTLVLIYSGYYLALSIKQLREIKTSDIDFKQGTVFINDKERDVPQELLRIWSEYIRGNRLEGYIFSTNRRTKSSTRYLQLRITQTFVRAGVPYKHFSCLKYTRTAVKANNIHDLKTFANAISNEHRANTARHLKRVFAAVANA